MQSSNLTQFFNLLLTSNLIFYHWGEFWMVHTPFLISNKTCLIIYENLNKIITLKNFSEPFYLWFYPVDIRFGFSWNCWTGPNRTEPNNTESCFSSVYHCFKSSNRELLKWTMSQHFLDSLTLLEMVVSISSFRQKTHPIFFGSELNSCFLVFGGIQ